MNPKQEPRSEVCSPAAARARYAHALKFHEVAELVAAEAVDVSESRNVAAALAVLAGIAAADAACCAKLGRRSRGQAHTEATRMLEKISPGGDTAARHLSALVGLKDGAHYGIVAVTAQGLRSALRHAEALVAFARDCVNP